MFTANIKARLFITILALVVWLSPMTAWAHRFGGPNDPCERKVGASFIHITLYQPQFDPDAEYCNVVPRTGSTVVVVDVLGDDLRRMPIGLQMVATGKSEAPQTVLSIAPQVYRRGVADAQVVLSEGLDYVVRVAVEGGDQPQVFSFPIRVTAWYRMLIVPSIMVLVLISLIAISIARYYWAVPREKASAQLFDFDAAGARAPNSARGGR